MSSIQNKMVPTSQVNVCMLVLLTGSRQDWVYVKVVKYFYQPYQGGASFCRSFVLFMPCVSHAFVSDHFCLVVTCWERADLLTQFMMFYCILSLSHVVSWVRCGT